MGKVSRATIRVLKREVKYQLQRIREKGYPDAAPPGMRESYDRFVLLLRVLQLLERDGVLEIAENGVQQESESFGTKLARFFRFI